MFYKFLVIKAPDPDLIRIQFRIDPDQMNADPQLCYEQWEWTWLSLFCPSCRTEGSQTRCLLAGSGSWSPSWPSRSASPSFCPAASTPGTSVCCGSMKFFWCGSGSADQYLWLMDQDPDPDSAIFVSDLQDVSNFFLSKFFCILLFEGTFTSFFKDKKS